VCRVLADHPSFVRGHRVLEIGSGCGVCGILAAKLGAQRVGFAGVCYLCSTPPQPHRPRFFCCVTNNLYACRFLLKFATGSIPEGLLVCEKCLKLKHTQMHAGMHRHAHTHEPELAPI